MSIVYGNFDSMMLHYLKLLGEGVDYSLVLFDCGRGGSYGVCSWVEFKGLEDIHGGPGLRPVCTMTGEEVLRMLFVRFNDILGKVCEDAKEESVQTGQQPGDQSAGLDPGPGEDKTG